MKSEQYLITDKKDHYVDHCSWQGMLTLFFREYMDNQCQTYYVRKLENFDYFKFNEKMHKYYQNINKGLSVFDFTQKRVINFNDAETDLLIDLYKGRVEISVDNFEIACDHDLINNSDIKTIVDDYGFKLKINYQLSDIDISKNIRHG